MAPSTPLTCRSLPKVPGYISGRTLIFNLCRYATASAPAGPWTPRGLLNDTVPNSPTNHPAVVEYKDQWYFLYHTGNLPGGGEFRRSVCIDYLYYNVDGSLKEIEQAAIGVEKVVE